MIDEAVTGNAADAGQVREARRTEKRARLEEIMDVQEILKSVQGRRFLWRLLEHCKLLESIYEPSARIYYNAGKQDVGHFVLAQIVEARPEAFIQMMKEHSQEKTA